MVIRNDNFYIDIICLRSYIDHEKIVFGIMDNCIGYNKIYIIHVRSNSVVSSKCFVSPMQPMCTCMCTVAYK